MEKTFIEKSFTVTVENFKIAIAKEFDTKPENVIIDTNNSKGGIYGFDIKHEVLSEFVCIADDRVNNAMGLNKTDSIELLDYCNGVHTSIGEPFFELEVRVAVQKPIYKEIA